MIWIRIVSVLSIVAVVWLLVILRAASGFTLGAAGLFILVDWRTSAVGTDVCTLASGA